MVMLTNYYKNGMNDNIKVMKLKDLTAIDKYGFKPAKKFKSKELYFEYVLNKIEQDTEFNFIQLFFLVDVIYVFLRKKTTNNTQTNTQEFNPMEEIERHYKVAPEDVEDVAKFEAMQKAKVTADEVAKSTSTTSTTGSSLFGDNKIKWK